MQTDVLDRLRSLQLTVEKYKCFGEVASGFEAFSRINVLIGRNNSGKSTLIDVLDLCITRGKSFMAYSQRRGTASYRLICSMSLDKSWLKKAFPEKTHGGGVPASNHWIYGQKFIGETASWSIDESWNFKFERGPNFSDIDPANRNAYYQRLIETAPWPFEGLHLIRVSTERDVRREQRSTSLEISSSGLGLTNTIRGFINSDHLPQSAVEEDLLSDLNMIYKGDAVFERIIVQENQSGDWEIFLQEPSKGYVRLSQSGSSLKSVFLILATIRLKPIIDKFEWSNALLCIEEPENNLHPSLLRRLLEFLAMCAIDRKFVLFIATHSPVCIDWSSRRIDSQIIHVRHTDGQSIARSALTYMHNREILDDLDIRASDILQANGIIWVEGPSDRIYIKHWVDILSDRTLKEGLHYSIMFYAGRLLSHVGALPHEESGELISLLSIKRNAAVIIDSDKKSPKNLDSKPRISLNATKRRVRDEIKKINGFVWITEGREIENYISNDILSELVSSNVECNALDRVVELPALTRFQRDKVALAHAVAPLFTQKRMEEHLDLYEKVNELCGRIQRWNEADNA